MKWGVIGAALTSARVELRLLEAATACPPSAVDKLLACGLLAADADGGSLRFRHEIARRAVEQAIAGHRRAAIHGQVLAALCASGADDEGPDGLLRGRNEAAVEMARRAHSLGARIGAPKVVSDALNTEAVAVSVLGGEWEELMARALRIARSEGLHAEAGRAYCNFYSMYCDLRRFAEAEPLYGESVAYCDEPPARATPAGPVTPRRRGRNCVYQIRCGSLCTAEADATRCRPRETGDKRGADDG